MALAALCAAGVCPARARGATPWLLAVLLVSGGLGCEGYGANKQGKDAGLTCGNGLKEASEECDGDDLGGVTCQDLSWSMGELACSAGCTFDLSGCVGGGPLCGNWVAEYGEDCDTGDLGGASCESIGFSAGSLACRADCTFDPSGCGPPSTCGDGALESPEECDGADLGGATCQSRGYLRGTLVCGSNCTWDESGCANAVCGDGTAEGEEECDGVDLRGHDCVMLGHEGGTLACDAYLCLFDDSACY